MLQAQKRFLNGCGLLVALMISPIAMADFDYPGQGQLLDEAGKEQSFNFGFSFLQQEGEYFFKAGRLSMAVDEVPKRYTLELVLNDKQQIWVSDFSKKPLQGFEWKIGEHQLQLKKEPSNSPQAGQYKLTIDKTSYFFTSKNRGQIQFKFTDKGISEIEVDSMMTQKR
jgi:hypothetical protein